MKYLSIASLTTTCIAVGTVAIAPAMAVDFTRLDYTGSVTGTISRDFGFFDVTLFDETIELEPFSYTVDNLSGRLEDSGDSQLTIDSPFQFIGDAFLDLLGGMAIPIGEFGGTGEIYSGGLSDNGDKLSDFYFLYDPDTDVFTVDGYDFANIETCLDGTCSLLGALEKELTLPLPQVGPVDVLAEVSFAIAQTATPLNNNGDNDNVSSVASAQTGTPLNNSGDNNKVSSVPEPSTLLGLTVLGLGGFLSGKRKRKAA